MDAQRLFVAWYRCVRDGYEHAVTDEEFAVRFRQHEGCCRAVCGHDVTMDSVLAAPGATCPRCQTRLCIRRSVFLTQARHRRSGSRRWLKRHPVPCRAATEPRVRTEAGA